MACPKNWGVYFTSFFSSGWQTRRFYSRTCTVSAYITLLSVIIIAADNKNNAKTHIAITGPNYGLSFIKDR